MEMDKIGCEIVEPVEELKRSLGSVP